MPSTTPDYNAQAQEFLTIAAQFKLGDLITEAQHPKTTDLSRLAQQDLSQALSILQEIDLDTLAILRKKLYAVHLMCLAIKKTLNAGGKIFLCGCGATGRLSLTLETLWRERHPQEKENSDGLHGRVVSFMAGGDIALIKAVEEFEDHPEYGAQQLMELGFCANDLLISTTEGGETPFVIGATEKAAEISQHAPYFLYCNPDDILFEVAERSRRVLENENIRKLNLTVGPMAISGSTRMQATTILMLAVGLALTHCYDISESSIHEEEQERRSLLEEDRVMSTPLARELNDLYRYYEQLNLTFLQEFIKKESALYQKNAYLFYETDADFAITVLTDTTERAPTFSLFPFENLQDRDHNDFSPSLCYLSLPETKDVQEAWRILLGRKPRTLTWKGLEEQVGLQRLYGHDFSRNIIKHRKKYLAKNSHSSFEIHKVEGNFSLRLEELFHTFSLQKLSHLSEHIVLKMLLNTHSTLVMGRLERYEGNLMTYVRPSNNKLIDRAIRYVQILLTQQGIEKSYNEVAYACFQEMQLITPNEPIVLHTLKRVLSKSSKEL